MLNVGEGGFILLILCDIMYYSLLSFALINLKYNVGAKIASNCFIVFGYNHKLILTDCIG